MDSFERLRTSQDLTEGERAIVAYVLDHPEEAARVSSRELARRTLTSPTAVLRLSRKLGYENYNAFKVNIVSDLKRSRMGDVAIHERDSAPAVLNKMAELQHTVIDRTREKLSPEQLQEAADLVVRATYVDFVAQDALASLASYSSHILAQEGRLATVYSSMDKMIYLSFVVPNDHVVFLFSRSGTDKTVVQTALNLAERGVATIAVTANGSSPLADACSMTFELFFDHEAMRQGDIVFATSAKYLFDTLAALVLSGSYLDVSQLASRYADLYRTRLDRARLLEDENASQHQVSGL
ncbi:MAG: MurR/RpiR family transcriptional regulator [Atopobiaceae bacterium]|jgi:DNA-binding MurR/RpiR family transcriptional regulator|nr:MurR/RpiR family transcriptional regulator [Atopobiaceae bacterium]